MGQIYNCVSAEMFRGCWGNLAKITGLIATAVAAYVLFSNLTAQSDALEGEARYRSVIHRENADYRVEWVCKSAPSQQACIDEARQTARENEREEQGLAAQKITAWWTKVMGVAALIGMALSAVGVWLVKTTFDETRNANEIAINTLTTENRAWLKVDAKLERLYIEPNIVEATMLITVDNIGNSVARNVTVWGSIHLVKECYMIKHDFRDTLDPQFAPIDRDRNIWPNSPRAFENNVSGNGIEQSKITTPTFRVIARAVVEYHTVFDKPDASFRVSEYIFEVHQPNLPFLTGDIAHANITTRYSPETIEASSGGGRLT